MCTHDLCTHGSNSRSTRSALALLVIFAACFVVACRGNGDQSALLPAPSSVADVWEGARIIDYRPAGVSIVVLKGWDISTKGREATLFSPDKMLTAYVYSPPAKTFEEASAKSIEQVANYVDSAETDGTAQKWNIEEGLPAVNEKGIGLKDRKKVGWGSTVINGPAGPLQLVWYFDSDDTNRDANLEQFRLMLANIRKLANNRRTASTFVIE
jgi:hypothetical protein